jgi:hypothetical protein
MAMRRSRSRRLPTFPWIASAHARNDDPGSTQSHHNLLTEGFAEFRHQRRRGHKREATQRLQRLVPASDCFNEFVGDGRVIPRARLTKLAKMP